MSTAIPAATPATVPTPRLRLLAVAVVYAGLLLVGVSQGLGASSALHALAAALLLAVGAPWLAVQGLVTVVLGMPTRRHRAVAVLSLAYPAVLVVLYLALKLRR